MCRTALDSDAAVQGVRKACVLAPTTLQDEERTVECRYRLGNGPIGIDVVARPRSMQGTEDINARCRSGNIDILIGTHNVLIPDVKYKDMDITHLIRVMLNASADVEDNRLEVIRLRKKISKLTKVLEG